MKRLTLVLLVIVLSVFTNVNAQGFDNDAYGFDYAIVRDASGNVENIIDTLYNVSLEIALIDQSQISKLMFIMKDGISQTTIISATIDLSNPNNLPEGLTYSTGTNKIILGLGEYPLSKQLKFTILLQDINGSISDPLVKQ